MGCSESIQQDEDGQIYHPDDGMGALDEWVLSEDCMERGDLQQTEPYNNKQAIEAYKKDLGTKNQRLVFREYEVNDCGALRPSRMVGHWDKHENEYNFDEY